MVTKAKQPAAKETQPAMVRLVATQEVRVSGVHYLPGDEVSAEESLAKVRQAAGFQVVK